MIIYVFKNKINNKYYVGQTTRTFTLRLQEHLRHNKTAFDKALRKYGLENFVYGIIDTAKTIDDLNKKEIYWIKQFNSMTPNGYNLCNGGDNTKGYHHKLISRIKMSNSKKGRFKGKENPFFKKKHSNETRTRMRKAWTEERKEKLKEQHKVTKFYKVKVKNVETGEIFNSIKEAAEAYKIKATHITRVCKGRRKRTGGYHWEYI